MLTLREEHMLKLVQNKLFAMGSLMRDAFFSLLPWAALFTTSIDLAYANWPSSEDEKPMMAQCHLYEFDTSLSEDSSSPY